MFSTGEILKDRYLITSFIARGGSGAVYQAEDLRTRMPVAIKASMTLLDSRQITSLSQERIMYDALFGVPGIPKPQDFFTENRHHIFVLPYLGQSLREIYRTQGRFTRAEACRMGVAILETLEGMHQKGVLHLDIKPHNILYDGNYHLTDFGSAEFTTATPSSYLSTPAFCSVNIDEGGLADKMDDYESLMYTICAVAGELPWITEEWRVIHGPLKIHKTRSQGKIGNLFPPAFRRAWSIVQGRCTNYEDMKMLLSLAVSQAEDMQAVETILAAAEALENASEEEETANESQPNTQE